MVTRLIAEDTYILRSPQDKISLEEEKAWLKSKIKEIKNNETAVIDAFFDSKVAGQAHLEVGEFRGRFLGKVGISIAKEFRGEGLGEELMKEIESEAKRLGLRIIHLEVYSDNEVALNLYKKLGYTKFGELPESIDYQGKFLGESYYFKRLAK